MEGGAAIEKIVVWRPGLSVQFAPLIRNLSHKYEVQVIVNSYTSGWSERRGSGTPTLDHGNAKISSLEELPQVEQSVFGDRESTFHFAAALNDGPVQHPLERELAKTKLRLCVFTEPRPLTLPQGPIRILQRRLDYLKYYSQAQFALGAGLAGCDFLRLCGYKKSIVYPFGYVTNILDKAEPFTDEARSAGDYPELLYIGQLIHRKGLDVLISALASSKLRGWKLTLVGKGPEEANLKALAEKLGLTENITFPGPIPWQQLPGVMRSHDMVVIPSRFDGWCSVIPEALECGVPVVCSKQCGASSVLVSKICGEAFDVKSQEDLVNKLISCWEISRERSDRRKWIQDWWSRSVSPEAFTDYFIRILNYSGSGSAAPQAPWI
jgi:glycosyltransferase involved in cell wall biosynthesis